MSVRSLVDGASTPFLLSQVLLAQATPGRRAKVCTAELPYVELSGADSIGVTSVRFTLFLELLQRQVRPALHDSAHVHSLWLFSGGDTDDRTVRRIAADTLAVDFPRTRYLLRRATDGSIARAKTPPRSAGDGEVATITRSGCT